MITITNELSLPVYFISHGGGPWVWMDEQKPVYRKLEESLREMPAHIGVIPKTILAVSGHWEESDFTIMTSSNPPMIYDYSGFPEHTYRIKYAAPGAPQIADRVRELMKIAGFDTRADNLRGFDHGVFVPLAAAYPAADIPVLQLSIRSDYDPETHLAVGRALAPLRKEGVLIVGSGLSYHNLRQFGPQAQIPSREFDAWLTDTVCQSSSEQRNEKLSNWTSAPSARAAHPREDHLIPLMVAVGAAQEDKGIRVYHEDSFMGGISVSSYRFGTAAK